MPVTFEVTPGLDVRSCYTSSHPQNATELLRECSPQDQRNCEEMLHSSFTDDLARNQDVNGSDNGFVRAVIQAYYEHRILVIRPDDVWLAILTQFNHYVNGNAAELFRKVWRGDRALKLDITADGPIQNYNWADFLRTVVHALGQRFTDRDLQRWILPNFSTTEAKDTIVCSIVMMSTAQHFAKYQLRSQCGLPAVKLLGEKSDWENILTRIEKLVHFSNDNLDWYKLLHLAISRFVKAFEDPNSAENKAIWQHLVGTTEVGGVEFLTGWITAFCYWNNRGRRLHKDLEFDNTGFPPVLLDDVPSGFAAVPLSIVTAPTLTEPTHTYKATMIAGSMATRGYIDQEDVPMEDEGNYGTLQPEVGWSVFRWRLE